MRKKKTLEIQNVRNVDVGRVRVCMLCVGDNEERGFGEGAGVNKKNLV
jgi:hypothetical protein